MIVTKITSHTKTVSKIFIDYEHILTLFNKDVKALDIYEGKELSESEVSRIIDNFVYIGAKNKALNILERTRRTEHEMITKLSQSGYSMNVVENVIDFLKEYRFIDDIMYAKDYVNIYSKRKSKRKIEFELKKKGIDSNIIDECFIDYDEINEEEIIEKILSKYRLEDGTIPKEKFNKIATSLYRKGFNNSIILRKMREN